MAKLRSKKVSDLIKKELSKIIQYEVRDPDKGFTTITHVRMTDDLTIAYVYFTVLGDENQAKMSLEVLTRSSRFLRAQLGRFLHLRKMPNLKFFLDESLGYANKIDDMIFKINQEEKPTNTESDENK